MAAGQQGQKGGGALWWRVAVQRADCWARLREDNNWGGGGGGIAKGMSGGISHPAAEYTIPARSSPSLPPPSLLRAQPGSLPSALSMAPKRLAFALAFCVAAQALSLGTPALGPQALRLQRPRTPVMLGKKTSWSIGKTRKKAQKPKQPPTPKAPARGFGASPSSPQALQSSPSPLPPSSPLTKEPDAADLAAVAAAAGGETWRSYAEAALAQVEALEAEAAEKQCSPQQLLGKEAERDLS